jgi:uncharacterized protein YdhG (YjbR/CyaY superfamily)
MANSRKGQVMIKDVDSYLTALRPDQRAALTLLRAQLRTLLPDHSECLSYAMPGFRHPSGKMTAGYAAFKHHLGLYPHSGNIIPQIDCTPFKTSKSGVLFTPTTPLPPDLLAKIIHARLAEITRR